MLEIFRQKKRPEKFRPDLKINEERKVFNRQKVVSKIKTCFVQPSGLTPHFVHCTQPYGFVGQQQKLLGNERKARVIKVKMMSCFLSCLSVLRRCTPSRL